MFKLIINSFFKKDISPGKRVSFGAEILMRLCISFCLILHNEKSQENENNIVLFFKEKNLACGKWTIFGREKDSWS